MRCKVCGTPVANNAPSTPTGIERKFYQVDVPNLNNELSELNSNLDKISELDKGLKMKLKQCILNLPNGKVTQSILGSDFFRTRMGHSFFQVSVPQLIKELKILNGNLEELKKHK